MHEINECAAAIFRTSKRNLRGSLFLSIYVAAEKRILNFGIMNIIGADVFLWYSKGIGQAALILNLRSVTRLRE